MGNENEFSFVGWNGDITQTVSNMYQITTKGLECLDIKKQITIESAPSLPNGADTLLYTRNGYSRLVYRGNDNIIHNSYELLPEIENIRVFGKTIVLDFCDGTSEKATTRGDDEFSIEQGVTICLAKKLLSDKTNGHGHEAYNKLVNHTVKFYNQKCSREKAEREETEREVKRIEHKIAKLKAKKEKRLAAKRAAEREYAIEIQKEAYLRAMRQLEQEKN